MCGIVGVFEFDRKRRADLGPLEAMNRKIFHRGPDDAGIHLDGNVGLAVRRLSIIDLAGGRQPVCNEDGSVWIVFNGEIYNHTALRRSLEERGHHYRSRSDTETIVHLYEEYGSDCVHQLRGMFAFAVWDARARCLFCARDRLGIKPLYYVRERDRLLFASEIKGLLEFPGLRPVLRPEALSEFLAFGYLAGPGTMFAGVDKLLPGHWLRAEENGEVEIHAYWDLPQNVERVERSGSYYVRGYRELLDQAVESHLMSDVPLGMLLSGGLDSSVVAALMQKHYRDRIDTFSVGYPEFESSELPMARRVATYLGTRHHEITVRAEDFFAMLPPLIWHEDEPLVWPSSVSLGFVCRLAREHVKVVLTGEGSDETLAGYTRYAWTPWNRRLDFLYRRALPSWARLRIARELAGPSLLPVRLRRFLQHTFLARDGGSIHSSYFDNFYSAFSASDQQALIADGLFSDPYATSLACWEGSRGELLARLLYTDIKTYLVELLMKQDNMSMASSIESRVPYLDHVLVEFAARIPSNRKVCGLAGKQILKKGVGDLLPEDVIYQRKRGFPTPWQIWLARGWLERIEHFLLEPRSLERGLFRPEAIQRLLQQHRGREVDHSDRIWRLLNLELWQRCFLDADAAFSGPCPIGLRLERTGPCEVSELERGKTCEWLEPRLA